MWKNRSVNTLPRAFPPAYPFAQRYALFASKSAPANKQGNPYCKQCRQIKSVHEFYADLAK